MEPYFWQIPVLILVGIVAGFLNIIAGGGSLLTLPLLMFLGLPAATANGTLRIAVFFQNLVGITGFKKLGVFPARLSLLCIPPALLGSYIGANLAITVDEMLFRRLLALVMVLVLIIMAIDPMKRFRCSEMHMTPTRLIMLIVSFFCIGIYGGFVQAGVGFLIITALLFHGLDLVRINAVKVMVIFAFTAIALGVFVVHGQVDYLLGFSLAIGTSAGGWIGTHFAVKKGHEWIKRFVIATVLIFALRLLIP
jgi:uncharacterized membrane protein YfcA